MKTPDHTPLPFSQMVIFGQRGVGKTSFIERLKVYWKKYPYVFLDLDAEIERRRGTLISSIFAFQGESVFRQYEKEIFFQILAETPNLVLTVGGGFPVDEIPPQVHTLWLQRVSDSLGRIFLDRPRLNPNQTDLEEFFQRANTRASKFIERADEIFLMPEGIKENNPYEEILLSERVVFTDPCYLTMSEQLAMKHVFLNKVIDSGFEFRDDSWKFEDWLVFFKKHSPSRTLLSFRDHQKIQQSEVFFSEFLKNQKTRTNTLVDWALELGSPQQLTLLTPDILSLSESLPGEDLKSFLKRLESFSLKYSLLKASPLIESFSDLEILWCWQQQDPERRSVLPRSREGRWVWFQQFMKGRQKISFWKVSQDSTKDQPSLYQWLSCQSRSRRFAAVLGQPVHLSRTPLEQQSFFDQYQMPVLAIDLKEEEFELGIKVLENFGLKAAAVTSPLKTKAFNLVNSSQAGKKKMNPLSQELSAINTLFISSTSQETRVLGTNTDFAGFETMVQSLIHQNLSVLIWGGGGTLPVIKKVFPQAISYSVRTGQARDKTSDLPDPDILIWAAGPHSEAPRLTTPPKYVVDLNYREDSLARAFAKDAKSIYISGEKMFFVQAQKQREFWKELMTLMK